MERTSRGLMDISFLALLFGMVLTFFILSVAGCADGGVGGMTERTTVPCAVTRMDYPVAREEFTRVYNGRTFYADGNHLGYDVDLAEGTPIHPIACGIVRVYRPASGYGTLVAVLEHRLSRPMVVRNGAGEQMTVTSFLTIYGHIRPTLSNENNAPHPIRVGDVVSPEDVIGFVQNRAANGDGLEHLHFGIRLQSMAEAARSDTNWFRGYDASPSQRRWFADPPAFLEALMTRELAVRWHPAGTFLANQERAEELYRIGSDDVLHPLSSAQAREERATDRVISVPPSEIRCYALGSPGVEERTGRRVIRFDDAPAVYELHDGSAERHVFVSYETFRSWGWRDEEIAVRPSGERAAVFAAYRDRGLRRMREGTLVKGRGANEVSVVSGERRLPIMDWSTFLAMGYRANRIVEIDPSTLDEVAFPRGPMITSELASLCRRPRNCQEGSCDAGTVGGGGVEETVRMRDAGMVAEMNADAALPLPDATADERAPVAPISSDAGTLPPGSRELRIEFDAALQAACVGGWEAIVWDDLGRPIVSAPGSALVISVPPSWRGYVMLSARCGSRYRDWAPANRSAREAGVASIRLNGVELAVRDARVCDDPWGPGIKVAIPIEPGLNGVCPR